MIVCPLCPGNGKGLHITKTEDRFRVLAEHVLRRHAAELDLWYCWDRSRVMLCPCGYHGRDESLSAHFAKVAAEDPNDESGALRRHFAAAQLVEGV